jgi:hypothetical protein
MVMNNHSYEDQTRRLLAETQSELRTIEAEIQALQEKAVTLAREVNAYEITLQGYLRRIGKQQIAGIDWVKLLSEAKTHKERLQLIAKHNDGTIRVSQATDILYTKKFTQTKKRATAYTMIQVMLADMADNGIFEKTGPGQYRLVSNLVIHHKDRNPDNNDPRNLRVLTKKEHDELHIGNQ